MWQQPVLPQSGLQQPGLQQPNYGQPPAAPYGQQDTSGSLMQSIQQVLQTIEQVRAKLHQTESIRNGYGYPQQPAYVDYDTVNLLDKLYDQLGDLNRELVQQQQRSSFGARY
jgi:hypothetical protein